MEHLLGLPLRRPKCSRRRSGLGRRKVFSRPCGGPKSMLWPPDVAQTPTFLTSNCGLTCSDRWSTCPQSLLSYPAVQVESIEKYDGRTYQTSPPHHQHRRAFRLRFKVIACTGPVVPPQFSWVGIHVFLCLVDIEKWYRFKINGIYRHP